MLVDFKYNILEMQISDFMNPMENSVFQSSLSGFHLVKPGLTKNCFADVNGVWDDFLATFICG